VWWCMISRAACFDYSGVEWVGVGESALASSGS
jgi:hypothetical protein